MNDAFAQPDTAHARRAPDRQLVQAALAGDDGAFEVLVRHYEPRLRRFLRPHVAGRRRAHDVDDLVQETFLRAWRSLAKFDDRWAFSTWLFTIATRLVIDRRRRREPVVWPNGWELPEASVERQTPLRQMIDTEQAQGLWRQAAQVLAREPFTMLWLFYAEQMSVAEVAHATRRSQSNVKVQLHRARQLLKKRLTNPASMDSQSPRQTPDQPRASRYQESSHAPPPIFPVDTSRR